MAGASGKSFYAVLGVARDASAAEIRSALRRLSAQWHPDKMRRMPESRMKERALARYQEIQDAYKVLSDPPKRALYDAGLLLRQQFKELSDMMARSGPPAPVRIGIVVLTFPAGSSAPPRRPAQRKLLHPILGCTLQLKRKD